MRLCKNSIKNKCYPGTPTQENPAAILPVWWAESQIWQSLGLEGKGAAFVKDFIVYSAAACGSFISLYLISNNSESGFNESKSWIKQKNWALNSNKLPNLVS